MTQQRCVIADKSFILTAVSARHGICSSYVFAEALNNTLMPAPSESIPDRTDRSPLLGCRQASHRSRFRGAATETSDHLTFRDLDKSALRNGGGPSSDLLQTCAAN